MNVLEEYEYTNCPAEPGPLWALGCPVCCRCLLHLRTLVGVGAALFVVDVSSPVDPCGRRGCPVCCRCFFTCLVSLTISVCRFCSFYMRVGTRGRLCYGFGLLLT